MQEKVNFWSFIFSIICIVLFYIVSFSGWFSHSDWSIHPLTLVLCLMSITFLSGVIGFSGVRDWRGMARSVSTVVVTLSLSAVLGYILLIGSLFD